MIEVRYMGPIEVRYFTRRGLRWFVKDGYAVVVDGRERQPWMLKMDAMREAKELASA